jgi:hypothetical protein
MGMTEEEINQRLRDWTTIHPADRELLPERMKKAT